MPITISATASGSLAPMPVHFPQTLTNGGFLIEGSDIGPAVVVGDGNDERTTWTFDFNSDPSLILLDPFRGLISALLKLVLTPHNTGVSTDLVFVQGLPAVFPLGLHQPSISIS
jgi:hypothetical protein